jgi:hypothetical protein
MHACLPRPWCSAEGQAHQPPGRAPGPPRRRPFGVEVVTAPTEATQASHTAQWRAPGRCLLSIRFLPHFADMRSTSRETRGSARSSPLQGKGYCPPSRSTAAVYKLKDSAISRKTRIVWATSPRREARPRYTRAARLTRGPGRPCAASASAFSMARRSFLRLLSVAYQQGPVRAAVREGRQEPDAGDPVQVDGPFAGQGARRQVRRRAPERGSLLAQPRQQENAGDQGQQADHDRCALWSYPRPGQPVAAEREQDDRHSQPPCVHAPHSGRPYALRTLEDTLYPCVRSGNVHGAVHPRRRASSRARASRGCDDSASTRTPFAMGAAVSCAQVPPCRAARAAGAVGAGGVPWPVDERDHRRGEAVQRGAGGCQEVDFGGCRVLSAGGDGLLPLVGDLSVGQRLSVAPASIRR